MMSSWNILRKYRYARERKIKSVDKYRVLLIPLTILLIDQIATFVIPFFVAPGKGIHLIDIFFIFVAMGNVHNPGFVGNVITVPIPFLAILVRSGSVLAWVLLVFLWNKLFGELPYAKYQISLLFVGMATITAWVDQVSLGFVLDYAILGIGNTWVAINLGDLTTLFGGLGIVTAFISNILPQITLRYVATPSR